MNQFPGALIKWYYEAVGNEGIIKQNKSSEAETKCVIGMVLNGKIQKPIIGTRIGKIATVMKGDAGFGWDSSFIPDLKNTDYVSHNGKSYAELPPNIKNLISHRWDAFNKLKLKCAKL
jgi:non-canonical purine NTP pyrophosphatase (RdgB/HAM1 family)